MADKHRKTDLDFRDDPAENFGIEANPADDQQAAVFESEYPWIDSDGLPADDNARSSKSEFSRAKSNEYYVAAPEFSRPEVDDETLDEIQENEYDWPTDEGTGRKRKKRRKKHYFIDFLIIVLVCVGGYYLAVSDAFSIDIIEVKGNAHFTAAQIIEMSGIPEGANMWKTRMEAVKELIDEDPYIEKVEIARKPLHRIIVTVKERSDDFVVKNGSKYIVLDYEGFVLRIADEPLELPIIENMVIEKAEPGFALAVKQSVMLTDVITFLKKAEESDIYFKRIAASEVTAMAYIYDHLACRGTLANLTKHIEELRTVFLDLNHEKIKRGTIMVSGNGTCTFSPEEA